MLWYDGLADDEDLNDGAGGNGWETGKRRKRSRTEEEEVKSREEELRSKTRVGQCLCFFVLQPQKCRAI
jgi:hypothetical protein